MNSTSRLPLTIAIVGVCWGQVAAPIRVDVRLVNVAFAVRDSRGGLVTDLKKEDIEVFDDGAPQTISYFARSADLPLTLGLVVDVSGSQEHFVKQHESDLDKFLKDVLGPRDKAFLLRFGNHLRLGSDFSGSSAALLESLKDEPKNSKDQRKKKKEERKDMQEIAPDLRSGGTAFYDALYYATTLKLAPAEGSRKAIVLFSDGEDNSSAHHMLDAIEAAQIDNVPVFGVRYTEIHKGRLNARNKYGMSVIARICKDTGGVDFDAEKADLHQSFLAIGEELRSSYEIAYHSTVGSDGTFHKVQIRVKRPGFKVRAKTGYFGREQ